MMNPRFLDGSIVKIFDTQTFGKFIKREFLIETDEDEPQQLKLEFHNDDTKVLDKFIEGEMVTIGFLIMGAKWQDKYFTNLKAIAISEIVEGKVYDEYKKAKAKPNNKKVQKIIDDKEE
jgi:hypothetical protein